MFLFTLYAFSNNNCPFIQSVPFFIQSGFLFIQCRPSHPICTLFYSVRVPFHPIWAFLCWMGPFLKQKCPFPPMLGPATITSYYRPFGQYGPPFNRMGPPFIQWILFYRWSLRKTTKWDFTQLVGSKQFVSWYNLSYCHQCDQTIVNCSACIYGKCHLISCINFI